MRRSIRVAAIAGLMLSVNANASDYPPALEYMVSSGAAEVVDTFETETSDLDGYVVKQPDGSHVIVYGMGDYAMAGVLVNPDGDNLTKQYSATHIPKPDHSSVGEQLAGNEFLVSEGSEDAPEIYVFSDPNCPYCKKFFTESRQLVEEGKVRIHWVMVAFLHQTSETISSAVMSGGVEVLAQAKTTDRQKAPKASNVPASHANELEENNKAMSAVGISGTPGFLYKNGDSWETSSGAPSKAAFEKLLASIDQ